ncbi:hypothetical protein H2201_008433 [Coniosporium apollinis]|uniref:Peptidase C14 caspase domain-containing protein n=1 Tax=Coniosporium apollinis TaxID=61459 RepID=A0ABQ9NG75_9PEZI|nr:hypothetical protein H2201_008433 [Coniosporium apollinis]
MALQLPESQSNLEVPVVLGQQRMSERVDMDAAHTSSPSLSHECNTPITAEQSSAKSRVQNIWDTAINKSMGVPDGYEDVAVLIIKWDDKLDDLNHGPEVKQLEALFKESFGYPTKIVNLGDSDVKPQLQLNSEVNNFVAEHDGQNNLMIIYYTGHGSWDKTRKLLELRAERYDTSGGEDAAKAFWANAESALLDGPDGDVLAIFDACYASNVQKSVTNDARTYQLIAASGFDQQTAAPGKNSFTTALIKSLRELLHEHGTGHFTVNDLAEQINLKQERQDNPCLVHTRLKRCKDRYLKWYRDRYLRLAPLPSKADRAAAKERFHEQDYRTYFTLRFANMNSTLKEEQITIFAQKLWDACVAGDIQAGRIHMIDYWELSRLKALGLMLTAQSRFRRPTLRGSTPVPPSSQQVAWADPVPPSTTFPIQVQLVSPQLTPDTLRLPTASSSRLEERAPASGEIVGARRSLWHIEINTALQVLLTVVLIGGCMNQTWWHNLLNRAIKRWQKW